MERLSKIYRDFTPKHDENGFMRVSFQSQMADYILKLKDYDLFQIYAESWLKDEDRINALMKHNNLEILKRFTVKVPRYRCPDCTEIELLEYMFRTYDLFPEYWVSSRRFEIVEFCIRNGAPVDKHKIYYLIRPKNRELLLKLLPSFVPLDEKSVYGLMDWSDLSCVKFIFDDVVTNPDREILVNEFLHRTFIRPETVDYIVERFKLQIPLTAVLQILSYRWDNVEILRHLWVKYQLRIPDATLFDRLGRENGEYLIETAYKNF